MNKFTTIALVLALPFISACVSATATVPGAQKLASLSPTAAVCADGTKIEADCTTVVNNAAIADRNIHVAREARDVADLSCYDKKGKMFTSIYGRTPHPEEREKLASSCAMEAFFFEASAQAAPGV